jgi:hypothetical protein
MTLLPQDISLTAASTDLFLNMPAFFKYLYIHTHIQNVMKGRSEFASPLPAAFV